MERRTDWLAEPGEPQQAELAPADGAGVPQVPPPRPGGVRAAPASREAPANPPGRRPAGAPPVSRPDGVIEIDAADDDLDQIVRDLDR
jgi:hypothetical protein